jgi:hypothetical protein
MGSAAPKKRPMRSIRSGIKKLELVKANLAVLKKLVALVIIIMFTSCISVREVHMKHRHNAYERHRLNSYTSPMWIEGRGTVLQTHIIRHKRH